MYLGREWFLRGRLGRASFLRGRLAKSGRIGVEGDGVGSVVVGFDWNIDIELADYWSEDWEGVEQGNGSVGEVSVLQTEDTTLLVGADVRT